MTTQQRYARVLWWTAKGIAIPTGIALALVTLPIWIWPATVKVWKMDGRDPDKDYYTFLVAMGFFIILSVVFVAFMTYLGATYGW